MTQTQHRTLEERKAAEPSLVCRVPSGWLEMSRSQFLRGYCILRSEPVVSSINDLDTGHRAQFLLDMTLIGDAIMEVTGANRMNYFLAGNFDPVLHAHIVPRYLSEPEQYRKGLPWSYPGFEDESARFDCLRDAALVRAIEKAVQKHIQIRTDRSQERTKP